MKPNFKLIQANQPIIKGVNVNQKHPLRAALGIASACIMPMLISQAVHAQSNGVKYDFAYPKAGDPRAQPSQVYDDGKSTYIQMRRNQAPFKVFAVTRQGEKELIRRASDNCSGDCVVVDGTYEEIKFASEGVLASVKYTGGRQAMAAGVQSYGAAQPAAQYGAAGQNTLYAVPAVNQQANQQAHAQAQATAVAQNTAQYNALVRQAPLPVPVLAQHSAPVANSNAMGMVLGNNAQGQPTLALTTQSGSPMPTLDGTVISSTVKPGYQPPNTWVKSSDIASLQQNLNSLANSAQGQRLAGDYNFAKANCLLDLSKDVHVQARNNGVTEHLMATAAAHRNAAVNNHITSYRTPTLPGEMLNGSERYSRQNQGIWRELAELHQQEAARCAPAALACASVQLLGAEFKRGEGYPGDAIAYEAKAIQMIGSAKQAAAACPPMARPAPPATPVATSPMLAAQPVIVAPAPAPAPAPVMQLKVTKETLSGLTLFDVDNATLTSSAQQALKTFAQRAIDLYSSITNLDVVGYADRLGNATRNQVLSENRAKAVKDWLVNFFTVAGKSPTIVNATGAGSSKSVTGSKCNALGNKPTKALEDCLAPDRRVEISLIGDVSKSVPVAAPTPMPSQAPMQANIQQNAVQAAPRALPVATTAAPVPANIQAANLRGATPATALSHQLAALEEQRVWLTNELARLQQVEKNNAEQDKARQAAAQQAAQNAAHEQALEAAKREGQRVYKEMMDKAMAAYTPRTPSTQFPDFRSEPTAGGKQP